MITNQKLQTLSFSEDINDLLCQIDVKISEMSRQELDSNRFGFCYTLDKNRYFILVNYRKILEDKANNRCCLKSYSIDDIINIIKQYLTSGKVLKFKTTNLTEQSTTSSNIAESGINMSIIYKYYGDNIINNSYNNRYVTEVVEDVWDQTDF